MAIASTFDRYFAAIQSGAVPSESDRRELERRASEIHNNYPQKIDGLHAELKAVKTRLDATRLALESRTEAIVQAVVMAKTPEGKPLFSNESLRSIEIKKRIAADPQCALEIAEVEQLESEHSMDVILLERAKADYSAWKTLFQFELAARTNS